MTPEEHSLELKRLERQRAAKRKQSKANDLNLASKLELHKEVKALDDAIHAHMLNYFELTATA